MNRILLITFCYIDIRDGLIKKFCLICFDIVRIIESKTLGVSFTKALDRYGKLDSVLKEAPKEFIQMENISKVPATWEYFSSCFFFFF